MSRKKSSLTARAFALMAMIASTTAYADTNWPVEVHASYEIRFNGLKVGNFEFASTNNGQAYTMTSNGKVSVLLGAMKWTSTINTKGQIVGSDIRPQQFDFDLKGSTKGGTTKIGFTGDTVSNVEMTPPPKHKDDEIKVEPQHLKGVLDPFSAIMAMTKGGTNPCARKIPVYDGKRRLDISMQAKGEVPLLIAKPADQPTTGVVCRVNYKLVAGHRPGDENTYMNKNQHIEMTLRPIPSANIYVPYQVTASTLLGNITIFAKTVTIVTKQANQQIVLAH